MTAADDTGRRTPTGRRDPAGPDRVITADSPLARESARLGGEDAGLFKLLVGSVLDYAIFALDRDGYILTWNAGAARLKQYTAAEIIGRHFSTFYAPESIAVGLPTRVLDEATRLGRAEDEGWRLRKDGTRFWASVVITALRDEAGTLVGFAKVTRDLTERRAAEQELRDSEERFRLLVQGVRDYAIFMLDPEGRIASWNAGAQRIKGYSAEEITGQHFSTFYPAEDVAAGKPARELEVATRTGTYEEEGWRVRKDGTLFWAHVLITAVRQPTGRLLGFAKVTRDLTERRAAQERAIADARRVASAEAASRTKSEFLTSMSHELRTPLNAIGGYAELIEMGIGGPITPQQREYLERIRGSQQHLVRIISELLDYGRIEAGRMEYKSVPVAMPSALARAVHAVEQQALVRGIAVHQIACDDDLVARGDATKTEQIVINLLSNAVKFTPPAGRVTVQCVSRGDAIAVTVTDTGPGIAEEHQHVIFEPFVQLGRSLKSGHEGTGLGLAIARDLARAMGGDVTVASAPGQGASFTVSLPRW